jgi:hypothetical protein
MCRGANTSTVQGFNLAVLNEAHHFGSLNLELYFSIIMCRCCCCCCLLSLSSSTPLHCICLPTVGMAWQVETKHHEALHYSQGLHVHALVHAATFSPGDKERLLSRWGVCVCLFSLCQRSFLSWG